MGGGRTIPHVHGYQSADAFARRENSPPRQGSRVATKSLVDKIFRQIKSYPVSFRARPADRRQDRILISQAGRTGDRIGFYFAGPAGQETG